MITQIKHKSLGFLAMCVLALSACGRDNVTPEQNNAQTDNKYVIVEGTGERVSLEISGVADLSAINTQSDAARYIIKGDGTQPRTAPIINLDSHVGEGNAKTLLIRLVERNNPSLITERIVTPSELLIEGSEGKYKFSFKIDVTLKENQSFSSGEWYISGIYGGTVDNPTRFELVPRFVTNAELVAGIDLSQGSMDSKPDGSTNITIKNENGASMVIPWTRVYTKANPSLTATADVNKAAMDKLSDKLGRNFSLTLKPDGVLFRIRPVSRLVNNILYNQIRVKTSDITIGSHTYQLPLTVEDADLTSGAFPKVTSEDKIYRDVANRKPLPQFTENVLISDLSKQGFLLPSGDFGRAELLVWGFPVDGQGADQSKKTEIYVHSSGRSGHVSRTGSVWSGKTYIEDDATANGAIKEFPEKDIRYALVNKNLGNAGIQDNVIAKRWGTQPFYQTVVKKEYKRGRAYLMLPIMDSDLIITERYSAIQEPTVGSRVGLIEIYNPTLRDIDVSQYGLVRVAATGMETATTTNVYNEQQGGNIMAFYGKLYAFPHVSEPLTTGGGFWDQNFGFAVSDVYNADPRLMLPHNKEAGQRFQNAVVLPFNMTLPSRTTGIGLKGTNSLAPVADDGRDNVPKVTYYTSVEKNDYTVKYRDFGVALGAKAFVDGGPNLLAPGQTMIILTNKFLETSVTPSEIPFEQDIRMAATNGYCKYVVAMNNAQSDIAEPLNATSGVMTLGSYDIPVLVKKRTGTSGVYYHIVDGLWSTGVNSLGIGGYVGYAKPKENADPNRGLFNRYVEAKTTNKTGLWEKRSVGGAIFNYPIGYSSEQTEARPYTPGSTDDFASFGVLLFEQQTTPRSDANYTIKWKK